MKRLLIIILSYFICSSIYSNSYVGKVVKVRGEASQLSPGKERAVSVKKGDMIQEDTSILTYKRSIVILKLIDKSKMTIGPNSKVIIQTITRNKGSLVGLLVGKIRTEVQKNVKRENLNKLIVKTKSAALGIRGTDFQVIYNSDNNATSLVTFKGNVAMVKIKNVKKKEDVEYDKSVADESDNKNDNVDEFKELNLKLASKEVVEVVEGRFAGTYQNLKRASLPVKISPTQFDILKDNKDFSNKINKKRRAKKISKIRDLKGEAPPEGFYNEKTGEYAPRAGGLIDFETGIYVQPEKNAKFDKKNRVYIPKAVGRISKSSGKYIAPKGFKLDSATGFVAINKSKDIVQIKEQLNNNIAISLDKKEREEIDHSIVKRSLVQEISIPWIKKHHFSLLFMPIGEKLNYHKKSNNSDADFTTDSGNNLRLSWIMDLGDKWSIDFGVQVRNREYKELDNQQIYQDFGGMETLSVGMLYYIKKNIFLKGALMIGENSYLINMVPDYDITSYVNIESIGSGAILFALNHQFYRSEKFEYNYEVGLSLLTPGNYHEVFGVDEYGNENHINWDFDGGIILDTTFFAKYKYDNRKGITFLINYSIENRSATQIGFEGYDYDYDFKRYNIGLGASLFYSL